MTPIRAHAKFGGRWDKKEEGADPVKLGLSKDKGHAYLQFVNPGWPYTEGGTAIFDCRRVEGETGS